MKKAGKKYIEKDKLVPKDKFFMPEEAIKIVKQTARAKFDETVDLSVKSGLILKKGSPTIRGTFVLPGGGGKSKKVAVIAKADKVGEAEKAGADIVGSDDLAEKILKGFVGFDVLIATPDMMGAVAKLGKVLGKRGLMPNPKTGTVTFDVGKTVTDYKSGKVEFKADKTNVINLGIGKISFDEGKIVSNLLAALEAIYKSKPSGAKGDVFKSITLSATMGPGIKVDAKKIQQKFEADA